MCSSGLSSPGRPTHAGGSRDVERADRARNRVWLWDNGVKLRSTQLANILRRVGRSQRSERESCVELTMAKHKARLWGCALADSVSKLQADKPGGAGQEDCVQSTHGTCDAWSQ
jgi:hypothetical protein